MHSTFGRPRNVRSAVSCVSSGARWRLAMCVVATLSIASMPFVGSDAPIADAEMRGDSAAVRQLIKQGADVNGSQGDGMTALHWAAMHGDAAQAKMLVYAG